jgi:hypothetical protein
MDLRMLELIKETSSEDLSALLEHYSRFVPDFILREFRKYGARYSKDYLRCRLTTMSIESLEMLMPEEWSLITPLHISEGLLLTAEITQQDGIRHEYDYLSWMKIVSKNIDCSKIDWRKCSIDSLNNFCNLFRYDELKFFRENFGFTNVQFSTHLILNFLFYNRVFQSNFTEFLRITLETLHFFNFNEFKMNMELYIAPFYQSLGTSIISACIHLRDPDTRVPLQQTSSLIRRVFHKTLYEHTIHILFSRSIIDKEEHALFLHIIYIVMDMVGFHDDIIYFKPVIQKYIGIKASTSLKNLCYQSLFFKLRHNPSAKSRTSADYTSFLERVNFVLGV